MTTLFWAGDSTVQYNNISTFPQTGMGQVINLYLKPEVRVENHAKNGRSTKSFLADGRLDPIRENIQEGDILLIQFGHNDEKVSDPSRYTDPQTDYKANLRIFIQTAREKKAYPVLVTPLERRTFLEDGTLSIGEHVPYVKAMKEVAKEEQVPLIDLSAKSRKLISEAGDEPSKKWFMHVPAGVYPHFPNGLSTDNTHLRYEGAVTFAGCIAEGLKELGGVYADLLLEAE